jgi:hypothetical protein
VIGDNLFFHHQPPTFFTTNLLPITNHFLNSHMSRIFAA